MKNKVLLHVCCGVCSGWPTRKLREDGYAVTWFFYNPNIAPREEYDRRLEAVAAAAHVFDVGLVEGGYDAPLWLAAVDDMGAEPEGGARCCVCFRQRLEAVARQRVASGCDFFATTLTVSPHKDARVVNAIGVSLGPQSFLAYDFKKQEGFKKSTALADEHGLYRQSYCGCVYSKKTL